MWTQEHINYLKENGCFELANLLQKEISIKEDDDNILKLFSSLMLYGGVITATVGMDEEIINEARKCGDIIKLHRNGKEYIRARLSEDTFDLKESVDKIESMLNKDSQNFIDKIGNLEHLPKTDNETLLNLREKSLEVADSLLESDETGFVTTESCGDKIGKQIRLTEKKHNQFGYYNEGAILTISNHNLETGYRAGVLTHEAHKQYSHLSINSFQNEVNVGYDGFEFID